MLNILTDNRPVRSLNETIWIRIPGPCEILSFIFPQIILFYFFPNSVFWFNVPPKKDSHTDLE